MAQLKMEMTSDGYDSLHQEPMYQRITNQIIELNGKLAMNSKKFRARSPLDSNAWYDMVTFSIVYISSSQSLLFAHLSLTGSDHARYPQLPLAMKAR